MEISINWLAVALATLAGMIVAAAWYGKLFAAAWEKHTGVSSKALTETYGNKHKLVLLVTNFATALTLAVVVSIVHPSGLRWQQVLYCGWDYRRRHYCSTTLLR